MNDDTLSYDILIVGGGPAGLSCGISLKQINPELNIAIIEKGSSIGAHIISGAVIETDALTKIAPKWKDNISYTKVIKDTLGLMTKNKMLPMPILKETSNINNIIVSLGEVCKYLGKIAEELGIDVITNVSAKEPIYDNNVLCGILTSDYGLGQQGEKLDNFQPGLQIIAKQTIIAEGARGSITTQIIEKFNLRKDSQHQTYGLGIKELWEVNSDLHKPGSVIHTLGWPLWNKAYGGGFIYHYNDRKVAIGLITGLDYKNPYLDPFQEMQKYKTHPYIKKLLKNATRINYGARVISEGGFQSIPKLTFKGGLLIGDSAGFVNVAKIKGTNNAILSGIIAAKSIQESFSKNNKLEINCYAHNIMNSSIYKELYKIRNIRPAFKYGLFPGIMYSGLEMIFFKGKLPWTLKHHKDRDSLLPADKFKSISYPRPDNLLTFDKASSLYLSGTMHRDNQESHLKLSDPKLCIEINYKIYSSPETRYCPAEVYEIVYNESNSPVFQINFQNCLHCKACDIKDPNKNIHWTPPEGGEGPNYMNM